MLIYDATDYNGGFLSKHSWIGIKKKFLNIGLKENDRITFKATVKTYLRKNNLFSSDRHIDYQFTQIKNLEKIGSNNG